MPDDLIDRISASLVEERHRMNHSRDDLAAYAVPLSRRGPSSRLLLGLSGLAVAAAAAGVVVLQSVSPASSSPAVRALLSATSATLAPSVGSRPAVPDERAAEGGVASGDTQPQGADGHSSGKAPMAAARPRILLSNTDYTRTSFVMQAVALARHTGPAIRPLAPESPAIGPLGTPLGVSSCLQALGIAGAAQVTVDLATFEGQPAAVLVTSLEGRRTARVVERHCGASSSVLHGPVGLP